MTTTKHMRGSFHMLAYFFNLILGHVVNFAPFWESSLLIYPTRVLCQNWAFFTTSNLFVLLFYSIAVAKGSRWLVVYNLVFFLGGNFYHINFFFLLDKAWGLSLLLLLFLT